MATSNNNLPRIGDTVSVVYLSGAPIKGKIVAEFALSAQRISQLKKYYPTLKEGDKGYHVEAGKDIRSFLAQEITIISRAR